MVVGRPDAELVAAARAGDLTAFGDLVDRYQRAMVASALHLVGDADDAEDVAQESFVQAFRSLRKLREPGRFRAWLYGILRRVSLKHLSRRRAAVVVSHEQAANAPKTADPTLRSGDASPRSTSPDDGRDAALLDELRRLPTTYREVLAARYLQGLTYREIAQALGTSEGNIRIRCLRARQRLRAILAEDDDPPSFPRFHSGQARLRRTGSSAGASSSHSIPTPGGCAGKE